MNNPEVLICGAGPTGLVLALWLTKTGVPVRIIDKSAAPGLTSRALVIHARTLEFYRQMGIDKSITENGFEFTAANFWVGGKKAAHVRFSDPSSRISPYPYAVIFPQDKHEEVLVAALSALGVAIERNTELINIEHTDNGINVLLTKPGNETERCHFAFLAGCDGAHSAVRKFTGFDFPGGTYAERFYVADLEVEGAVANGEMNAVLDDADFLAVFPMQGKGRIRLVGAIIPELKNKKDPIWEDVSQRIIRKAKITVKELHWFSTYKVHHRVAAHFRQRNIFLLGDAGHLHSPVGGQGMNTGIGDAINLGWKLSSVVRGQAPFSILDTYEPERIGFARKLVATTDKVFTFVSKRSRMAGQLRTRIVPQLLSVLFRLRVIRRLLFRKLSQTEISYRNSALSEGGKGRLAAGDRLPWVVPNDSGDSNYDSLRALDWVVHCYGSLTGPSQSFFNSLQLPVHVYAWSAEAHTKGLTRDSVYVIRPDGHIGCMVEQAELEQLRDYLKGWRVGPIRANS